MPYSNFNHLSNDDLKTMSSALRSLSIDMVERANSGHPGMPLGIADVLTVLFAKFIKFNPLEPKWINRDRFILSAGHGSAVLYSLLYLLGYPDCTMEDLQNFRQLHSKTAGHPEYGYLSGIEVTTGPLGQGIANGVGMAISESILRERLGKENINHKTYVLAGDGCFMEGISFEAMSLAGHLGLSNLIYIYDKNNITIDGKLSLADSTDFVKRFTSIGFNVFESNGHDYAEIESALKLASSMENGKPSIVICETKIGFGSPSKEGSEKCHGSPLGAEEIAKIKKALGVPLEAFAVEEKALNLWRGIAKSINKTQNYIFKDEFTEDDIKLEISKIKTELSADRKEKATRQHSSFVLSKLTAKFANLICGSADLSESNGVKTTNSNIISKGNYKGNFIHYGIREHAMGAIMNGIALHSNFKSLGSTFLVFSDYMRPPIRLAALMKIPTIFAFTHDSFLLGEDGPTHQPIEHLTSLRIIPNLVVIRPADSIETAESYEVALLAKSTPHAIILSRSNVKECTPERKENMVLKGAYFALNNGNNCVLYASGSEVSTAFEVKNILKEKGIEASIVSIPSLELFEMQSEEYRSSILNAKMRVFIEAGIEGLYSKYIRKEDLFIGLSSFGESGKAKDLIKHFNMDAQSIANKILSVYAKNSN